MLGHRMAFYGWMCQVICGGEGSGRQFATNKPAKYGWGGENADDGKTAC